MTTAAAVDQERLLDVQALDSRLAQLEHRRATLPEAAEAAALETKVRGLTSDVVVLETRVGDLDREVSRAENDVATVRNRAERDRARLAAGTGNAKDLVGLQHEIDSLARRQGDLEDIELEILERREADTTMLQRAREQLGVAREALADVTARRDSIVAGLGAQYRGARTEREQVARGVAPALLALYDKVRAGRGGVGAVRLVGGRCDGCHLDLPPSDLAAARAAAPDAVLRCEECGRILVRGASA